MKNIIKFIIIVLLVLPALLTIIIIAWIGIQYLYDPLDSIDLPTGELTVVQDSIFEDDFLPPGRIYHDLILKDPLLGDISCLISTPDTIPEGGLPVVIILGGLEVGKFTLKYIPDPGRNILVIYKYPYHPEYWYQGSAIGEIPHIRRSVLKVPAQVISLTRWIGKQIWVDGERISITGYSFGAFFIPAVYRLISHHQLPIKHGVIAYGGVNIFQLLVTNMTNVSESFRSIISWLAATSIRGVEPSLHAPHLDGNFLLINGTQDHQIPKASWQTLHQLIPDPKTIVILEEGHMHPRNVALTRKLVKLSHEWLIRKNLVNY